MEAKKTNILFICMGNICRSAAAEAVLKKYLSNAKLDSACNVDSAGIISYHAGERADSRMIEHAFARGYSVTSISRPVTAADFAEFSHIIAMDNANVEGLKKVASSNEDLAKISKLTDYCSPEFLRANGYPSEVPDPYYGGSHGFELVLDMLEDASTNILKLVK